MGVGGEDDGVDEVGHRHGVSLSRGWMLLCWVFVYGWIEREVLVCGACGAESCWMQRWGGRDYIRESKTVLAHNALSARVERVYFVLEHGDCVFQQEDNGQRRAQYLKG